MHVQIPARLLLVAQAEPLVVVPVPIPPLDVLEVVLDDIERLGFFDEHIFPMTFPIAISRGIVNPANYYLFDISNMYFKRL